MRLLVHFVMAGLLLAATRIYWNGRFGAIPEIRPVSLGAGMEGEFHVERLEGGAEIVRSVALPFPATVGMLHIEFEHRAVRLTPGRESWQVGRLIMDWCDGNGKAVEHDTLMTMKGHDIKWRGSEMIVKGKSGLQPRLRVEHLGLSGIMEVRQMRIHGVKERQGYFWFGPAVVIAWGAWIHSLVSSLSKKSFPRRVVAALILLGMGWFLALPGPWEHIRPLAGSFATGILPDQVVSVTMPDEEESKTANSPEPLGEMPVQASWLFRVKIWLSYLRPILHVLLFAVPAFVICGLCGPRCAFCVLALMAVAVEAAQTAFWSGFDWVDVADLLVDCLGIALGVRLMEVISAHHRVRDILRSRGFS